MTVSVDKKKELVAQYGESEANTGSTAAQIAILTERIRDLTTHLQANKRDFSTRRGLLKVIGKRRRLQVYLQRKDPEAYSKLIRDLGLRR
ncbi:uncharacterized protein METZ01_LOCUS499071 [marine metagenome]|uniref:30S ribosomal protein S15 n=1 Tax=marine metagenome TaxID=408172 RepID=A0A383DNZ8_9ZZZZ